MPIEESNPSPNPPSPPLVRARHLQSMLRATEAIREGPAILRRLRAGSEAAIRAAAGVDWLDAGLNLELAGAVEAEVGAARTREHYRDALFGSLQSPLWRALLHLIGGGHPRSPATLARWVPRAWKMAYRDVGTWEAELLGGELLLLRLRDLPRACARHGPWINAVEGAVAVLLLLAGTEGQVLRKPVQGAQADFLVSWKAP
jgi:hypothetical protein